MTDQPARKRICTVTLNPAIDHTAGVRDFRPSAVNRVLWEQEDPGGKGVNVAAFLGAYGMDVTATGLMGRENEGAFRALFGAKGIAHEFVPVAGRTRSNIKLIDEAKGPGGVTDVNFPGFEATEADLKALESIIARLAQDHEWFVLSGSLPAGLLPETYGRLIRPLRERGRTVVLDTSGPALTAGLEAQPGVIKPNIHELEDILGRTLSGEDAILSAIADLHGRGIGTVIVSLGADGAIFSNGRTALKARPPEVPVRTTVGAGDAMVAGFVAGSVRGLPLEQRARLATAFAIAALGTLGPRLPPVRDVEARLPDIAIETLSLPSEPPQ